MLFDEIFAEMRSWGEVAAGPWPNAEPRTLVPVDHEHGQRSGSGSDPGTCRKSPDFQRGPHRPDGSAPSSTASTGALDRLVSQRIADARSRRQGVKLSLLCAAGRVTLPSTARRHSIGRPMSFSRMRYSTSPDGVADIVLARPDARNAQDRQMLHEINDRRAPHARLGLRPRHRQR